MQTLVIGDIHGCYDELQSLLDKSGLTNEDLIISIGDHIDRGPRTPDVLNFFRTTPHARLIMGNHERKHIRASRHEVKLARSQQISKLQFGHSYSDALAFITELPLYIELPEAILAHGYFEPGIRCQDQNPLVLCGTMGGQKHLQTRYTQPWYELYDGNKPTLVGHQNYTGTDQPFVFKDHVFGLDTDCVLGKALTGLLLPSFVFVSVPSRANHWMHVRRQYPKPTRPSQLRPTPIQWNDDEELLLGTLIERAYQVSETIMQRVGSMPGFADMTPRAQTRLYGAQIKDGTLLSILHLARLGKLNADLARKVVRTPSALQLMIQMIESE